MTKEHHGSHLFNSVVQRNRSGTSLDLADYGITAATSGSESIPVTARLFAQGVAISGAITKTLPACSAFPAGIPLVIADFANTITATNTITVARAGSDTIDTITSYVLNQAGAWVVLMGDGVSKWKVVSASITGTLAASLPAAIGTMDVDDTVVGLEDGVLSLFLASQIAGTVVIDSQEFTTVGANTWTIPAGAVLVQYRLIGGGSGGGSGRCDIATTDRWGGGGGGAGGVVEGWIPSAKFGTPGTNVTITIGDGGNGGAAVGPGVANGNAGVTGGATSAGTVLTAGGAGLVAGGGGGQATAQPANPGDGALISSRTIAVSPNPFANSLFVATPGGASSISGAGSTRSGRDGFSLLPGGGGAGGGIANGGAELAGGTGGSSYPGGLTGGTGGAVHANGSAPASSPDASYQCGAGGGGGGSSTVNSVNGGSGGAGGVPGGGGGGGGAVVSGGTAQSGAGGKGGKGYARMITICVR